MASSNKENIPETVAAGVAAAAAVVPPEDDSPHAIHSPPKHKIPFWKKVVVFDADSGITQIKREKDIGSSLESPCPCLQKDSH